MADLSTLLRAAPIGLFMLIGSYLAARRRRSGASRAVTEFPAAAARLGLDFRKPTGPGLIGAALGAYGGYRVYADSDERPRIVVYFPAPLPAVLRTFEHEKRVPRDMARFDTGSKVVDAFFKERYATHDFAEALEGRTRELEAALRPLAERRATHLVDVSITEERLECALEFGRPRHIPASVLETLLPEAVRLADVLSGANG